MIPRVFSLVSAPYVADSRQPAHSHGELQITLILRGGVEERVGASVAEAGALSVVVKDPGVVHADRFGREGALTTRLSLRGGALLADLVDHPTRARAWKWTHDPALAIPFVRLVQRGLRGETRFAVDDDDIVDLLAAASARAHVASEGGQPAWLAAAIARVEDGWVPGLTVRDVARAAGVHPVYLARCMRRWHGMSAADLLRRARMRHAALRIADDRPTIARVAHATGFADESHLCRAFARAAGVTPARFRRLARAVHMRGVGR